MAAVSFSAVVLAAGRSTRMGRDKALLEVDGVPLWRRQRDLLRSVGAAEVFLSARPEQTWTRRAEGFDAVLHDAVPDLGPLSGITAAIERASHGHVAVIAIDLPRLPGEWFRNLLALCVPGAGAVGAAAGQFEPLAAIYPRELMWSAWEAMAGRRYALQPLLAAAVAQSLLRTRDIAAAEQPWFENWNEPSSATPGDRPR